MRLKKKNVLAITLLLVFSLLSNMSVFAASESTTFQDENGDIGIETPIQVDHKTTVTYEEADDLETSHFNINPHSHYISNVSKTRYNVFYPVTSYSANYTKKDGQEIEYSQGSSFEISASYSTSVGVSAEVVEAGIGTEVGAALTVTANTTYHQTVPYGYKGRIVYRYSYDHYTFDCYTDYLIGSDESGTGYAESKAYDGYFTIQTIALW